MKRLFESVFEMKQDRRRLENKTPMEIINMDRKTELKRLLCRLSSQYYRKLK